MSLLSESVTTVLAGQQVQGSQLVLPPTLNPPIASGFYKQQVGIGVPRGQDAVVLVYDVQTNAPLQLPVRSIPMRTFLSAVVPLVSASPTTSDIKIVFLKDVNNLLDYIVYNNDATITVNEVNNKLSLELPDGFGVGQPEYIYAGLLCSPTPPPPPMPPPTPAPPAITDGTVKIIYQYV